MSPRTTTKSDITETLYSKLDMPVGSVQSLVDAVFELMKTELAKGMTIKLPGFGNFKVVSKRARMGRNPKTGEEMEITARKVVSFAPSVILRERVDFK